MPSQQRTAVAPTRGAVEGEDCWCGQAEACGFGEDYLECVGCGTLRRRRLPTTDELEIDSDNGFYGRDYWFEHQARRGQPDLVQRSRSDLVDRIPRWLKSVLHYRSPGGRSLEIGCAHGAFTYLLKQAGFDAQGIDLSSTAATFARERFGIIARAGALEQQELESGSFDLVIAIDVLEHVRDPTAFLARAADLVTDDGLLVLQTPCRPSFPRRQASRPDLLGYEALCTGEDPFLTMLIEEHLFLFPQQALTDLLGRLGFTEIAWQEPPFPYDMLAIVSRRPLRLRSDVEIRDLLLGSPERRQLLALLDFDAALAARTTALHAAQQTQLAETTRLEQVRRLVGELRRNEAQALARAAAAEHACGQARAQTKQLSALLDSLRHSGFYRFLVGLGRWRKVEDEIRQTLDPVDDGPPPNLDVAWKVEGALPAPAHGALAIDLTAILPGATNGGAKLTSLLLVRELVRLVPEGDFLVLTSPRSHDELASLEGLRVRRHLLPAEPTALMNLYDQEPMSLLICPMGPARWVDPRVPTLTIVHDLQHTAYPEFFAAEEREGRHRHLEHVARWSDRIVTVSEFVRRTVLDHTALPEDRVVAIGHGVRDRLPPASAEEIDRACWQYGLRRERYLLYPANCWPHKNHSILLTAFARLRHRRPDERLHLVLTGASEPDPTEIRDQAAAMGLEEDVLWLGYLPEATFASLLHGCRALVFPSLYEGFGMPIVEAMAAGRPVVCSDGSALREVAGDAALFFDPRKPNDLCAALERLLGDAALEQRLIAAGQRRVAGMDTVEKCARRYLDLAIEVQNQALPVKEGVAGVWEDGWTQHRLLVGVGADDPADGERSVELTFANSRDDAVEVTVEHHRVTVEPRTMLHLTCHLPAGPRLLAINIEPTFSPKQRGESDDYRRLGMELIDCRVLGRDGRPLLAGEAVESDASELPGG